MSERVRRVAVVGGGIGGLAAAVALRRAGFDAHVHEQAPELRAAGAGLSLWPNATWALHRLGALGAVARAGAAVTDLSVLDPAGRVLLHTRVGTHATPAVAVRRSDLQAALLAALPAGTVHTGRAFESFSDTGAGVRVAFAGGGAADADVLVGADGLKSRVRAQLRPGDPPPAFRGYTAWRGLAPGVPAGYGGGAAAETWGRGLRFGLLACGPDCTYWFATANRPAAEPDGPGGRKRDALDLFAGWHAPVPDVIRATPDADVLRNDVLDRDPARPWHRGRVVLVGDAAHPTTPNLGQGGGMALEDGVALAVHLARDPTPRALAAFEADRFARCARVTRESRRLGRVGQWSGVAARVRDRLVRWTPRRVAEAGTAWAHGHRV